MAEQLHPYARCASCSVPIRDSDRVLRVHGEWYHLRCGRARPERGRDEPPAVLCAICRTGIGTLDELIVADSEPMHIRCRPAEWMERAS